MSQNILKIFIERGFLLDREMLDFLNELKDDYVANEILNKIAIVSKQKLITKNLINQNIDKLKPILYELDNEKKKLIENFFVNVSISVEVKREVIIDNSNSLNSSFQLKKSEISISSDQAYLKNSVKVISSPVLSAQKLEVKDFVKHFRNRYIFLKVFCNREKS